MPAFSVRKAATMVALCTLSATAHAATNLAPALRWKTRVWLNSDFDTVSANNGEYTIVARFLPSYRLPNFGVIFAANGQNGHRLLLAQNIDTSNGWDPALSLTVDGTVKVQTVNASTAVKIGQWNYVAVTYKMGTGWRVNLNGTQVISVADGTYRPFGRMTIGNLSTFNKHYQYYGLIDDVAVFTKSLSSSTIGTLMGAAELPANATDMKYGWSFNSNPILTSASGTPTYGSNTVAITVSSNRSSSDFGKIPPPLQSAIYQLPIPVEHEAYVVKGNSADHHSGSWAWAWDFIYTGKRSDTSSNRAPFADPAEAYARNLAEGKGRKLVAVGDGEIVQANWDVVEGDGNGVPNSVMIRHAPGEYSSYYHFTADSFPEFLPWFTGPITLPPGNFDIVNASPLGTNGYPLVWSGEAIGGEGGTGMGTCDDCYHLHFAVLDQPDIATDYPDRITKPIEFSDYEYSYDRLTWQSQDTGVPQEGMYVRRKAEPVTVNPALNCGGFDLNQGMYPNQPIYSCDGRFRLYLQSDSNLVLGMKDGTGAFSIPLWATYGATIGKDGYTVIMHEDGDFAYFDSKGKRIWHTDTDGHPHAYLRLQNDGNLVVYREDGVPLWDTHTAGH